MGRREGACKGDWKGASSSTGKKPRKRINKQVKRTLQKGATDQLLNTANRWRKMRTENNHWVWQRGGHRRLDKGCLVERWCSRFCMTQKLSGNPLLLAGTTLWVAIIWWRSRGIGFRTSGGEGRAYGCRCYKVDDEPKEVPSERFCFLNETKWDHELKVKMGDGTGSLRREEKVWQSSRWVGAVWAGDDGRAASGPTSGAWTRI